MDKLSFVSDYFAILPWLLSTLGSALFIVSALGFISSGVQSKPRFMAYAVIMCLLSLTLIGK